MKDQVREIKLAPSLDNHRERWLSMRAEFDMPVDSMSSTATIARDHCDSIVLRFDDQWNRSGYPPSLLEYLNKVDHWDRSRLARELILVDMEYRCRNGEFKSLENYAVDYPEVFDGDSDFPYKFICSQFELHWEWFRCDEGPRLPPDICCYLSCQTRIKELDTLFWMLANVDFDYHPNSSGRAKLIHYLELFHDLFRSTPVIPVCMIVNQFLDDWKGYKTPEIELYLQTFLHNTHDTRYYREVLTALVDIDMREWWKIGKPKWIEDYLARFSELLGSDGTIPENLIRREQSLSLAITVDKNRIRCPYCHFNHDNEKAGSDCSRCGRMIEVAGNSQATPISLKNYQIIKLLGIGGYAKVFKAWDPTYQRLVALKLPKSSSVAWGRVDRIEREVQVVSNLQNPNIVEIYDYHIDENPGRSYIVYRYIAGPVLMTPQPGQKINYPQLIKLMITVTNAVHYAHRKNVIHRDLKPRNILIDSQGNPVVADFGLARFSHYSRRCTKTFPGELIGSVHYMSPEQISGLNLDHRTDVYSLGVILYRLLTGKVPFSHKDFFQLRKQICVKKPVPPRSINATIPKGIERICLRALEKDPWSRYATAADLARDLTRYLAGKKVVAKPAGSGKRLMMWVNANKQRTLVAALFVFLMVTCAVLTYTIQ